MRLSISKIVLALALLPTSAAGQAASNSEVSEVITKYMECIEHSPPAICLMETLFVERAARTYYAPYILQACSKIFNTKWSEYEDPETLINCLKTRTYIGKRWPDFSNVQ